MRQLRYFITVAEVESYRRASEILRIAQPAISRQIKLLEGEIGAALFDRSSVGAQLTEVGRVLLKDARQILASVAEARERAMQAATRKTDRLCVSFTSSPPSVVPEVILAFQVARPAVSLTLLSMDSPRQLQGLRQQRIDAAFLNMGAAGDDTADEDAEELVTQLVQIDNAVLALPASHELAARTELSVRDLDGLPLILFSRNFNPKFHDTLIAAMQHGGVTPRIVQQVNTSAVIVDLVSFGFGIGIVTTAMRGRLPAGVVLRRVSDLAVPYQLDLAWRRDNRSTALAAFIAFVTAAQRS